MNNIDKFQLKEITENPMLKFKNFLKALFKR